MPKPPYLRLVHSAAVPPTESMPPVPTAFLEDAGRVIMAMVLDYGGELHVSKFSLLQVGSGYTMSIAEDGDDYVINVTESDKRGMDDDGEDDGEDGEDDGEDGDRG